MTHIHRNILLFISAVVVLFCFFYFKKKYNSKKLSVIPQNITKDGIIKISKHQHFKPLEKTKKTLEEVIKEYEDTVQKEIAAGIRNSNGDLLDINKNPIV